jgi:hypothetical protein
VTTQFTAAIAQLGPDIAEFTGELAENPEVIKDFVEDLGNLTEAAMNAGKGFVWLTEQTEGALRALGAIETDEFSQITNRMDELREKQKGLFDELNKNRLLRLNPFASDEDIKGQINEVNKQLLELQKRRQALMNQEQAATPEPPDLFSGGGVDAGGGAPEGGGRGTTPQPGITGIDLQAARKRADEFDRIWADTLRRQHAMHESVAEENAEAYRTLDEEWAKAQKQFARLEEQTKEGSESMATTMENAITGWASSFSSQLNNILWESETTFDSILESFGKMLTQMIIQKQVVEPMLSGFGFGGGGGATTGSAHSGGIVGDLGETRTVSPAVFAGADRFHGGGLVGDEEPIIAKRGEGVFTPEQMQALAPISAAGGGKTEVHIHGAPEGTQTERSQTPDGGDRLDVWLDGAMAEKAGDPGSKFRRRLEASTNVRSSAAVN